MPGRLSLRSTLVYASWLIGLVFSFPFTKDTFPDIDNATFIRDCVYVHNKFRSKVTPPASDMLYMTWDAQLAQIAKAWAKNCLFQHNPRLGQQLHPNFTPLGENIWSGTYFTFSVLEATTNWYDEVKDYDYTTRSCGKVCGHYTQVVWADSFKVGCAVQFCPQVSGLRYPNAAHFVCNYAPAGNYPTWPYKKGSPCSGCHKDDICLDNLCTNYQRDKVSRYESLRFPNWTVNPRNRYTSLILIIKPPIIILSVIITIFVKYKYPHLTLMSE